MNALSIKGQMDQLVKNGEWQKAIDSLIEIKKTNYKPWMEIYLRNLRINAFDHLNPVNKSKPESPCPPFSDDPFPHISNKIPEIDVKDLDVTKLAGAIRHHGALIIRNFLSVQNAEELKKDIDVVFKNTLIEKGKAKLENNQNNHWFKTPNSPKVNAGIKSDALFMAASGSIWTLMSPKLTNRLLSLFDEKELKSLLTEYLEDTPCLSFKKWVLRKMDPLKDLADWHQDGSFMGENIKSINLWVALNECGKGTNSPGMDLMPKRLNNVLPTGTEGACFDWSISHKYVEENFDVKPERPYFGAGDAIFFDHLNLHVTSYSKEFTEKRYAIETWFFAQSCYPANQIAVVW